MTTTKWIEAQIKPLLAQLEAIKGNGKAEIAKRKPLQKQLYKIDAMKRGQRKYKEEK